MMSHLWEIDHPYYCSSTNYFSNECTANFSTWAEFLAAFGDADLDMNFLFRFDWVEESPPPREDIYYRNGELKIFWMGQRKGLFQCSLVNVCRADEPDVIEFLKPRWEHMQKTWEPFAQLIISS